MSVKPIQRSEIQGFSKGLVTELNPIAGQIDTTVDESNFNLLSNGTRRRRLGLDIEEGGSMLPTGLDLSTLKSSATSSFLWEGAAGIAENKFVVVQLGNTIRFFKSDYQTTLMGSLTLPFNISTKLAFGAIEGFLGVVAGTPNIGLVEYNSQAQSFQFSQFRVKIRDQFGIQETIDSRYETDKQFRGELNWQHYYNLFNQGWAVPRKPWLYGPDWAPVDAVELAINALLPAIVPSNSDVVWTGIARKPIAEDSLENIEAFHYAQYIAVTGSDTKAAKGHFLIDAFNRGGSRYDAWMQNKSKYPQTGNLAGSFNQLPDTTTGGPTSIASFAGRLFYSGCNGVVLEGDGRSPNYNNYVFFTQLIKSRLDFPKCYQEGDPTSRENTDIVDTDGGFFSVSEAINIHTMYAISDKLILIAENGVWAVTGGSGYGFAATNYKIDKLSTFGGIPNKSFVEHGGSGFFWGWNGIFNISKDQYGDLKVQNITKPIIESYYNVIPNPSKYGVQGFVDKNREQIRWIYTEGSPFEGSITKELVLDLKFQAFYPYTFSQQANDLATVIGGIQLSDFGLGSQDSNVVIGNDLVAEDTEFVVVSSTTQLKVSSGVKYLVAYRTGGTIALLLAEYRDPLYRDWMFTGTPSDAPAFMTSNAFTGADFTISKQMPYVTMAFAETEKIVSNNIVTQESACVGRFMWNYANGAQSGKWSRSLQMYRKTRFFFADQYISTGFAVNLTKTKVRGIGKAFALRVDTEPAKDCHIYGWNISLTKNPT